MHQKYLHLLDIPNYFTAILLPGICPKELKAGTHIDSIIHDREKVEENQMYINRWISSQNKVSIQSGILFCLLEEGFSDTATKQMSLLEGISQVKWPSHKQTGTASSLSQEVSRIARLMETK